MTVKKVILTFIILFALIATAQAKSLKIGLFFSRSQGDAFWGQVGKITKAACDDLGIELYTYWADGSLVKMRQQVEAASKSPNKLDVLILNNFLGVINSTLRVAEKNGVHAFIYNEPSEDRSLGHPQEKYKSWIGQMIPDDEKAGYDLSEYLINQARKNKLYGADNKIHMIAIEGLKASTSSVLRVKGLKQSQKEHDDVILHQIVSADWEKDIAKRKFTALMNRYPDIAVVWSASDLMSIGVIEGAKSLGKKPGVDILTGGVDWASEGLEAVEKGEMAATVGAHIWEGAWVAVLLYDYFNGINNKDFIKDAKSDMFLLDKKSLKKYQKYFKNEDYDKVDFKKFSKAYNKKLKKYDFNIKKVYQQLK